jgi:hypothetical protein
MACLDAAPHNLTLAFDQLELAPIKAHQPEQLGTQLRKAGH